MQPLAFLRSPCRFPSLAAGGGLLVAALVGCLDHKPQGGAAPATPPLPSGPSFQPSFGAVLTQRKAPPPLSGGTLVIAGRLALAADPDRDRLLLVDLAAAGQPASVQAEIPLHEGDEPGRAAADAQGLFHVVLRGAGAVVDVSAGGVVVGRRAVCPAPRGIAYDPAGDNLVVACAGGEVAALPAAGGEAVARSRLERDLRDVVVDESDGRIAVTTLRTARVLLLDSSLAVSEVLTPRSRTVQPERVFRPAIAWRTVSIPGGGLIVSHQRATDAQVRTTAGGYGADSDFACGPLAGGIIDATATVMRRPDPIALVPPALGDVVLPVDVAVSRSHQVAVVAAGNGFAAGLPRLLLTDLASLQQAGPGCLTSVQPHVDQVAGQPVAVAYDGGGRLWVQTREPSALHHFEGGVRQTVALGGASRKDTGWAVFHANSGAGLACASCHAEGGDDARVWSLRDVGPRRTQSLRGGITGRAPFHWSGDIADFPALVSDVFVGRMSGPPLSGEQVDALYRWVDAIPTVPAGPPQDAEAVARGRALFSSAQVGCIGCHSGDKFTNGQVVQVGTATRRPGGQAYKVASLVNLANHAPFLHDGCAATLEQRFGACGSESHGHTRSLSPAQIADLVAYLETL